MLSPRFVTRVVCVFCIASFLNLAVHPIDNSNRMDFDGDGRTDISVYREGSRVTPPFSPSYWYVLNSSNGQVTILNWGKSFDDPIPADYDGNGVADFAVFRALDEDFKTPINTSYILLSTGQSYIQYFAGTSVKINRNYWGGTGAEHAQMRAINVSEDPKKPCYLLVYDILAGTQKVTKYLNNICNENTFGFYHAAGDYNKDGKSEVVMFKRHATDTSLSHFAVWNDIFVSTYTPPDVTQNLDIDRPAPGDYDGDGKTDFAGYKYISGNLTWKIRNSSTGAVTQTTWGLSGDKPVPGYYDGDGKTDIAIFRPSTGTWWILNSSNGTVTQTAFGVSTDIPLSQPNYYFF